MRVSHLVVLAFAIGASLLSGCGQSRSPDAPLNPLDGQPVDARSRTAEAAISDLERTLDGYRRLPPAQALEKQRAIGPRADAVAGICAGTRFENKAVYFQAQWHFNFDDTCAGVEALLDRLEGLEKPIYKQNGRALRVQLQLRQGRLITARAKAEALATELPEFAFLLDLVRWHERVGGIVEVTGGPGLDGLPSEPKNTSESHLLYLLLSVWNEQSAFTVQRYQAALAATDASQVRLVLVIGDGDPQRIRDALAQMAGSVPVSVILARSLSAAQTLNEAWMPPLDAFTVLLGPTRRIVAVELRPGDLAKALSHEIRDNPR
jgi:hypothetical protein